MLKRVLAYFNGTQTRYTQQVLEDALPELEEALIRAQARLQIVRTNPRTIRTRSRRQSRSEYTREAIGEIEGYITSLEVTINRIKANHRLLTEE